MNDGLCHCKGCEKITAVEKERKDAQEKEMSTPSTTIEPRSVKNDTDKYDPTMLTEEMIEAVSRVRMFGAKKYGRNNFKKTGFKYTRSLAAVLRHIFAILKGEWLDTESGLPHAAHAICGLEHLIYDSIHHPENNDLKEK